MKSSAATESGDRKAETAARHEERSGPNKPRQDLFLLSSLLLLILIHPLLGEGRLAKIIIAALTFLPLILATISLSYKKWLWPLLVLIGGAMVSGIGARLTGSNGLFIIQWIIMTVTFGLVVAELFSYLQHAPSITTGHLYAAASIYWLLALMFFSLYTTIARVQPHAFQKTIDGTACAPSDLLYFSLATLTTLGYGDIVPVGREVRMLSGVEAGTGVLYVAITVALLVGKYRTGEI